MRILKTYRQNISKEKWNTVIKAEFNSHKEHETWCIVPNPWKEKNIIITKWLFSVKYAINGKEIPKARLVEIGCADCNTYTEPDFFSPVCPIDVIRFMLALAAGTQKVVFLTTMDVSTAYLNSTVNQEIYLQIPD